MTDKEFFDELNRRMNESKDALILYAKSELDSAIKNCKDRRARFMQERMKDGILRCIYIFTMEKHSFCSSSGYVIDRIYRLLTHQPLIPITEKEAGND